jgi:hypothetical protein
MQNSINDERWNPYSASYLKIPSDRNYVEKDGI